MNSRIPITFAPNRPESPLLRLVYVSSATTLFSQDELVELLRVSRKNNARDRITGMLLYKDGNFIQALEGPEAEVRSLHERIVRDPRHRQIITVLQDRIAERQFGEWAMGFVPIEEVPAEAMSAFTSFMTEEVKRETGADDVVRALETFRQNVR